MSGDTIREALQIAHLNSAKRQEALVALDALVGEVAALREALRRIEAVSSLYEDGWAGMYAASEIAREALASVSPAQPAERPVESATDRGATSFNSVRGASSGGAAVGEVAALREAVEHVVNDSPGTPESVKEFLRRALAATARHKATETRRLREALLEIEVLDTKDGSPWEVLARAQDIATKALAGVSPAQPAEDA